MVLYGLHSLLDRKMLLQLPRELLEHIALYCRPNDRQRLSRCSRDYNAALKPILWNSVAIPAHEVSRGDFVEDERIMRNVDLVRRLHFSVDFSVPLDCVTASTNFSSLVGRMGSLVELYVEQFVVSDDAFRVICTRLGEQLLSLRMAYNQITDVGLSCAVGLRKLEVLDTGDSSRITDTGLVHICSITTLKQLFISGKVTLVPEISRLIHLRCLHVRSSFHSIAASQYNFQHIESLGNLKELHIVAPQIPDKTISYLSGLKRLEVLVLHSIYGRFLPGDCLGPLFSLVALRELDVSRCVERSDSMLHNMLNLFNLEKLNLFGCRVITNEGLACLSALKHLKDLNIGGCRRVGHNGMEGLCRVTSLEVLNLNYCVGVTDAGIGAIATHLKKLRELRICFIPSLTDVGLKSLKELSRLERLYFSGSGVVGAAGELSELGFSYVGEILTLRELVLIDHYHVTDACIAHFANLTRLESFNLIHCVQMGDGSLKALSRLKDLRHLDLTGCVNVTVNGLQSLVGMLSLETLDLRKIPQLHNVKLPFDACVRVFRCGYQRSTQHVVLHPPSYITAHHDHHGGEVPPYHLGVPL